MQNHIWNLGGSAYSGGKSSLSAVGESALSTVLNAHQ